MLKLICLTLINIYSCLQYSQNSIISLDDINDNAISTYLLNCNLNQVNYTTGYNLSAISTNNSANTNSFFNSSLYFDQTGASINYMSITQDGQLLTSGIDYSVFTGSSSSIVPFNAGYTAQGNISNYSNNTSSNTTLNCFYSFSSISATINNIGNFVNYTNIYNFGPLNFAYTINSTGVTVIRSIANQLYYITLDSYANLNSSNSLNNKTIMGMWLYNGNYVLGANLIVLDKNYQFYVFNVSVNNSVTFMFQTASTYNYIGTDTINQAAMYYGVLILASQTKDYF